MLFADYFCQRSGFRVDGGFFGCTSAYGFTSTIEVSDLDSAGNTVRRLGTSYGMNAHLIRVAYASSDLVSISTAASSSSTATTPSTGASGSTIPSETSTSTLTPQAASSSTIGTSIGAGVGSGAGIAVLGILGFFLMRKWRKPAKSLVVELSTKNLGSQCGRPPPDVEQARAPYSPSFEQPKLYVSPSELSDPANSLVHEIGAPCISDGRPPLPHPLQIPRFPDR
jgi:hypothetical protein